MLDIFSTAVKYRVALVDGSVVEETPEGGVEFYVKDGMLLKLLSLLLTSCNREYSFIFHLTVCLTNYGAG